LITRRRARGLTQQALATLAGLTSARLRVLEQGGANARLTTVARLADSLDCHPFELLVWKP
jgi:transcriptional regulator with XRE-family HTH domain